MVGANLLALRTLAIDAALMDALRGGIRQVVILGAGFDARAYRLAELAEARVFEVDHPATQALKRAKAQALPPTAQELRFVSVNFEHESLGPALAAAGHRAAEPTAWIWEGVVMYLSDAALYSTLREIAAASAVGSTLIVNYHTPSKSLASRLVGLLLRLWNEPQIGLRNPEVIAAELHQAGFEVSNDSGIEDWARAYGGTPHHSIARRVRLAVARK
jgi:methyltransferase (TIGR00027 family)